MSRRRSFSGRAGRFAPTIDKAVEREKLAGLIDLAHYAPTGTNSQQVQWLVINSREQLHAMAGMIIDMLRQSD